jgi:hypothetical protein
MLALSGSRPPEIECLRKAAQTSRALSGSLCEDVRARAVALRKDGVAAEDLARAIGVHETTLYGWVRSGKYDGFFRPVSIEAPGAELSPNEDISPLPTRMANGACGALFRVRYPKGTRIAMPLENLTPEILSILLSVETSR